jgi:hypothetical protein
MALVTIVYVPTRDMMGPDITRMGKVEDLDPELARMMLADGTARKPSAEELAVYDETLAVEEKADEALADGGDLTKMRKTDLLALAAERGVPGVDESLTKPQIAKAIDDHAAAQGVQVGDADRPAQTGDLVRSAILTGPSDADVDGADTRSE